MTLKYFDSLKKRDFENGAILNEIRNDLKERDNWKKRCELAERFIAIDVEELVDVEDYLEAYKKWQQFKQEMEGGKK